MTVIGTYLGMELRIDAFAGRFHLQRCASCQLLRYPPTTACPWCSHPDAVWTPVEGVGAVHSYAEVHHAIQPAFQEHLPYLILILELDTQRGQPGTTRCASPETSPRRTASSRRQSWTRRSASARASGCSSRPSRQVSPSRSGRRRRLQQTFGGIPASCGTLDNAPRALNLADYHKVGPVMSTARARLDKAGRILIPARLRKEIQVAPGDAVVLETRGDELHLRPYRKAIREAQAIIAKYIPDRDRSLVDELIEERRREAENE